MIDSTWVSHNEDVRGPLSTVVHLHRDPLGPIDRRILGPLGQVDVSTDQLLTASDNLEEFKAQVFSPLLQLSKSPTLSYCLIKAQLEGHG